MAALISVQTLLQRHENGINRHRALPTFDELGVAGKIPHIIVVTCADPRCIPENFLHLEPSEVIVMRNAGGSAVKSFNDILALDTLVGVSDVLVIKHTDCGATAFKDPCVRQVLKERVPHRAVEVDEMEFGNITTPLEDAVREDLRFLRGSDLLRKEIAEKCVGFVYDLKTGKLNSVE